MMQTYVEIQEQFESYIQSFEKTPGMFTRDELLEIGIRHKQLPQHLKNWKKLVERVGYDGTASGYRSFVNRSMQKTGDLPMQDIDAIVRDSEEFERLYMEKTQIRDTYNAYRLSLRNVARVESFKSSMIEAINSGKLFKIELSESMPSRAIGLISLEGVPLSAAAERFISIVMENQ